MFQYAVLESTNKYSAESPDYSNEYLVEPSTYSAELTEYSDLFELLSGFLHLDAFHTESE